MKKTPFKEDTSKFILITGLKIASIPLITSLFVQYIVLLLVKMNQIYLESNGLWKEPALKDVFVSQVFMEISEYFIYMCLFIICLFFIGCYLGQILLRPFKVLGDYSLEAIENPEAVFSPDLFSDFRILNRFSEYFYNIVSSMRQQGGLQVIKIPTSYQKIRKPVFDKVFFFHFSLFLLALCLLIGAFTHVIALELHEIIINISSKNMSMTSKIHNPAYFLQEQANIIDSVSTISIAVTVISYMLLAYHLYGQVSGAAFGIFSTMRAFLKGGYSNRVHLIGYTYLRQYTRAINKYLDYIERNFAESKPESSNKSDHDSNQTLPCIVSVETEKKDKKVL